jgi:membrane-associated phospholipid phosphatase
MISNFAQSFYNQSVNLLYGVGFFGEMIQFILVASFLFFSPAVAKESTALFAVFAVGFMLSSWLNKVLKLWLKQPRPSGQLTFLASEHFMYRGPEKYGMPSGHAQGVFYCVAFLFFTGVRFALLKNGSSSGICGLNFRTVFTLSLAMALITLYQRWHFRNHTTGQLLVGAAVGCSVAALVYFLYVHLLSDSVLSGSGTRGTWMESWID